MQIEVGIHAFCNQITILVMNLRVVHGNRSAILYHIGFRNQLLKAYALTNNIQATTQRHALRSSGSCSSTARRIRDGEQESPMHDTDRIHELMMKIDFYPTISFFDVNDTQLQQLTIRIILGISIIHHLFIKCFIHFLHISSSHRLF